MECTKKRSTYGFGMGGWTPRLQDQGADDGLTPREREEAAACGCGEVDLPWEDGGEFDVGPAFCEPKEACSTGSQTFDKAVAVREESLAPLIAVVSGSGGVGRSTLAFLMACVAAQEGIDTVLLEGDLQFGDYGFWLGIDDRSSDLGNPCACEPVRCPQGFDLYKAPVFPEVADEVSDALAENLDRIRAGRGLVIADTGGYWSGFTASLLLQCDLFLMVTDGRAASVNAALKASELCSRLGVPSARMVVACNRWSSRCVLSPTDVARSLGVEKAHCIPDGREVVEELLRGGEFKELAESGNPVVSATSMLLQSMLPRVGIPCDLESFRKKGLFK